MISLEVKKNEHFLLIGLDESVRNSVIKMDENLHQIITEENLFIKMTNGNITITIEKTKPCDSNKN